MRRDTFDIVIVGAGHGGAQAAIALRQAGFAGTIALIGAEPDAPYERPPLSKDYLAGEKTFERILIRPATFWSDRAIDVRLGVTITAVDPAAKVLTTHDGDQVAYGQLIWATGGAPRRLSCSGHHLSGVHTIRARADVDRLVRELPAVSRVVVVGGGYIGLEAAAALVTSGKHVTLLEAQDRVLARVAGAPLSRFYEDEHRAHGVDVRLGQQVTCLTGNTHVTGVALADGTHLPCEMVVVGVGIEPAVAPLLAAGAKGGNGVAVDGQCRTSLPGVFAIGDCALHSNPYAPGGPIRLESVQNANDQATVAAKTITGASVTYDAVPWFWSTQYDLKLQTVGLSAGHDAVVVRGDPDTRAFALVYLRDGKVIALDCVNVVRDYVQGRKLVEARASVPPDRLADVSVPLKEMLAPGG